MTNTLLLSNDTIVGGCPDIPLSPDDFAGMGRKITGHAFLEDVEALFAYMRSKVKLTDVVTTEMEF